jgi:SRSO17 transposase
VLGLLPDLPRKNCWSIAGWAGEATPDGMQHLPGRARWDAGAVRDDVRECVLEHLHDEGAVLVASETGDVKKRHAHRRCPAPVHRHRREDRERASHRPPRLRGTGGHAAVDRELYIPRSWTCDADRCRAAGLGEDTVFAAKPEQAARMTGRFPDAGHRAGRVASPGPSPSQPLSTTSRESDMKITIYGWSPRRQSHTIAHADLDQR